MRPFLAQEQGLTLAEILPAVAVLSIGLVALASLLPVAGSGVHEGGYRSVATFLAAQRLEHIRHAVGRSGSETDLLGVSPSPDSAPVSGGVTSFPDEPALAPPHASFGRTVRVRDCSVTAGCSGIQSPGMRQVTVTVSYASLPGSEAAPGAHRAVVLTTYLAPR